MNKKMNKRWLVKMRNDKLLYFLESGFTSLEANSDKSVDYQNGQKVLITADCPFHNEVALLVKEA